MAQYITVYLDMENYAVVSSQGLLLREPKVPPDRWFSTLISKQFPIHIRHYVFGPWPQTFKKKRAEFHEFTFVPARKINSKLDLASDVWGEVADMFWSNALVFFYEQNRPWIQSRFGPTQKDRNIAWPPIFRFAWALRNAAAHHGGKLNITDATVPPITWHHLSYDHQNFGTKIYGDVMNMADMLIFLIEMSDELDRLGAPKL